MRWNACVHRLDFVLYSHSKEFLGNGVRTHANSEGKIPAAGNKFSSEDDQTQDAVKQDSEPNTLPTSYSGPRNTGQKGASHTEDRTEIQGLKPEPFLSTLVIAVI